MTIYNNTFGESFNFLNNVTVSGSLNITGSVNASGTSSFGYVSVGNGYTGTNTFQDADLSINHTVTVVNGIITNWTTSS